MNNDVLNLTSVWKPALLSPLRALVTLWAPVPLVGPVSPYGFLRTSAGMYSRYCSIESKMPYRWNYIIRPTRASWSFCFEQSIQKIFLAAPIHNANIILLISQDISELDDLRTWTIYTRFHWFIVSQDNMCRTSWTIYTFHKIGRSTHVRECVDRLWVQRPSMITTS